MFPGWWILYLTRAFTIWWSAWSWWGGILRQCNELKHYNLCRSSFPLRLCLQDDPFIFVIKSACWHPLWHKLINFLLSSNNNFHSSCTKHNVFLGICWEWFFSSLFFLYIFADCLLCREIFSIGFHLCRGQLLKRVRGKNMSEEDGQIGLEELRSFSRRKNGNSGSSLYFFETYWLLSIFG